MTQITCGHCKAKHDTVADVRRCYADKITAHVAEHGQPVTQTLPAPRIEVQDGYYTVVFGLNAGDAEDRVTIRLHTQAADANFAPGKIVASYLTGSDNTRDYVGFAFVDPTGRISMWKRFAENTQLRLALETIVLDPAGAGEAYALRSSNCWKCNRLLTVPASVHRGLGPVCAHRLGVM